MMSANDASFIHTMIKAIASYVIFRDLGGVAQMKDAVFVFADRDGVVGMDGGDVLPVRQRFHVDFPFSDYILVVYMLVQQNSAVVLDADRNIKAA